MSKITPYGIIYLVTNIINDKKYIGQTTNIKNPYRRWGRYFHDAHKGKGSVLASAIKKYGADSFIFDIIWYAFGKDALNECERHFISILDTIAPRGYNLKEGGNSGGKCSKELREKLKIAQNRSDTKLKQSLSQKITQNKPEVAAIRDAAIKAVYDRPGEKERRAHVYAKLNSTESKKKAREGWKRAFSKQEVRNRHRNAIKEATNRPEIRKRRKDTANSTWANPDIREKRLAGIRRMAKTMGASIANLRWITNGKENVRVHKDTPLPHGWEYGRLTWKWKTKV